MMRRYYKSSIIFLIVLLICFAAHTVSAAGEWETYDYSRFNNSTYIYDIGGNFNNVDLDYYNEILRNMQSKYGITYTFILVGDYNDEAWDLAAVIREKAGYSQDYISAIVSVQNRDLAVYTLGKGQQVMNDSYVDGMLDAMGIDLRGNDWDGALYTFIDLAPKMTDSYINDTNSVRDRHGNTINYKAGYHLYDNNDNWNYTFFDHMPIGTVIIVSIIVGLLAAVIAVSIETGKHRPVRKAVNADFYVREENVKMSIIHDSFLRSHEVKTRVRSSSSGGGGGRSGGSTRTGSSGRSGGGGSRRF